MGAVRVVCVKIYPVVYCRSGNRWKMMMLSVVLSIGLINKMILKYQSEAETQTTTT